MSEVAATAEASVAGQIAEWVGGKIGNQAAALAINHALGYLGLEPGQDVDSKLAEMNAKLDEILSHLDVLNTKVDQLSASITTLTNNVDVGLKQAYAEMSESALVPLFGAIDTKFGKRASASSSNLFGLMHLPPSGKSGVATTGHAFVQSRQQFWD